ncbi:aminopeptidase N-like [Nylanderia fulva]|uniref:aminopeptidase N-like n=1 Tax=Nylanderia fulva TaxID=613905 RepID=UPI0010FB85AD|nr:aminopeptidase N-like [Nylanderia fulva]
MMFLEWSLNILLYITVITMATFTNENAKIPCHTVPNYRNSSNNDCIMPIHYNLDMIVLPGISFIGELNATFYINCEISNITLHIARSEHIVKVMLKSPNGTIYTPNFDYSRNFATFNFIKYLSPENTHLDCGVYTMYVKYEIIFVHRHYGMYYIKREDRRDKEFLFANLLQPRNARQLFPCWDDPKLKATFNITVKLDTRYYAISNTIPIKVDFSYNGMIRLLFHMTPKISVNDVTIIMFDLQPDYISKINKIYFWSKWDLIPYMKWAQYVAGNVSMYLENKWRIISRSEPKMDYVIIPIDLTEYKRRNCGVILFSKTNIIYNKEFYPVVFKTLAMRSVAHNILHYWFINFFYSLCRFFWWLNKGFVVFLESYIIDKIYPNSRMMDLFVVQIRDNSHYLHPFAVDYFKENSNYMFKINLPSPFSYTVGAALWRMLERIIPSNVFWTSIDKYLNRKFISSDMANTFNDLWSIMPIPKSVLKLIKYNLDINKIMAFWSTQQHYPVLNVTRYYSGNSAKIFLEFQADMDQNPYCIPVTFTEEASINFNVTGSDIYLTPSNPKWEIQFFYPKKWIIFNLQQIGFYRVNYDDENWKLIARYLNSEQYTNIHVLNRAQIIDDSFHLMTQGKLNFSTFWELSSYLWQEKFYVAWYPMFKALEYMSNIIPFFNSELHPSEVFKSNHYECSINVMINNAYSQKQLSEVN